MKNETFKLTSISEKAQISRFGEVLIAPDTEFELVYSRSKYALVENVEFCSNEVTEWIHVDDKDELSPELFNHSYANHHGWSDVHPYEVVKHNSPLKMTVRAMDAELDDWKPEIIPGGFAGHCVNNAVGQQKYKYTSNEENGEIEIRFSRAKRKRGWFDKHGRRFIVARNPFKHYDYNF